MCTKTSIAIQHGNKRTSAFWWLKYYVPGRSAPIRMSSGTDDYGAAVAILKQKRPALLRRGFRLGLKNDPPLVERAPYFPMFHLENEREGVVSYEHYRPLWDSLPSCARIALVIAYHTGARKGEIRKILRERIDFNAGRVELAKKTTKGKKALYLPIYGDMRAELDGAFALQSSLPASDSRQRRAGLRLVEVMDNSLQAGPNRRVVIP